VSDAAGLERLLRELRAASSPVERVKLLGRAWKTLRRLDRSRLKELAARAGFDRAEGLLERLARNEGRLTPSLLLQIVRRVRDVDANQVDDLVRGLRDPERRRELLRDGLEVAENLFDQPTSVEGAVEASPPSETEPPPAASTAGPVEDRAPAATTSLEAPPTIEVPAKPAAAFQSSPVDETPTATPPPPPLSDVHPGPPMAPDHVHSNGELDDLIDRLTAAPTTLQRLNLLRRELALVGNCELDGLRRLIDAFPEGWPRRRALTVLLRAGVPRKLMHAVFLIERLQSPAGRRWCAGALLDSRPLTPDEREALIVRHGLFPHRRSAGAA
jgi:hypothetical protein